MEWIGVVDSSVCAILTEKAKFTAAKSVVLPASSDVI